MRQNLSYIFNAILGVAVIILFVLHFSDSCSVSTKTEKSKKQKAADCSQQIPIAYIDIDTLLLNYNFAKDANARLLSKSERSQAEFNKKMSQWQKEGAEFQRKYETNSFISRERAEQENTRLMKKRQELEELDAKLTQELMEEQKKMNEQLRDTINLFLKEYNKDKKFQVILSNTMNDNVLSSEPGYNITSEIVELLNARYNKGK
ncbi:MAG: OmpH family outer membrane protein [Paludibacteraceae bacterium]|nr:OmpH family outer membrane protein [Paludibacteraceae bacterium]MBN2788041.1 OmpH family outer membrane protein [Paludibacteraceae bacterium]